MAPPRARTRLADSARWWPAQRCSFGDVAQALVIVPPQLLRSLSGELATRLGFTRLARQDAGYDALATVRGLVAAWAGTDRRVEAAAPAAGLGVAYGAPA